MRERVIKQFSLFSILFFVSLGLYAQAKDEAFDFELEVLTKDDCRLCHSGQAVAYFSSLHGQSENAVHENPIKQCETCHGEFYAHIKSRGESLDGVVSFANKNGTFLERNQRCMNCHEDSRRMHWQGSMHETSSMDCSSCHKIHGKDAVLARNEESKVCFSCHQKIRADLHKPSSHPSGEVMSCRDCHNSHGSTGDKLLRHFDVNLVCYECHANLRGPFLWEHPPASDNCLTCHEAHGSSHYSMLKRRAPFLCQQCHQNEVGSRHVRRVMDLDALAEVGEGRFIAAGSCMNCHSKVHGSNHPSGVGLSR
ncbi:MAG: cystathionine beta-synthase [Sedimenticola sp.]|nr:MAG: cystathionine beta-synthase [Sedimenticola sp.]